MLEAKDIIQRLEAMAGVETSALYSQRKTLKEAAALIREMRTGIKRLSDEEELCAETTGDDPFSMVYLAAKLAAAEAKAGGLAKKNERLRYQRDEARLSAQKIHRRCQQSERCEKLVLDTLADWTVVHNSKLKDRHLFRWVMRELARKCAAIRAVREAAEP